MNCPNCQTDNTHVLRTTKLPHPTSPAVKRVRHCHECDNRWVTIEITFQFAKELEKALNENIE